jgi:hypothetical protein
VEAPHEHSSVPEHVAAIDRERRVVVNFDAFPSMMHLPSIDVEHMKAALFEFIDDPQTPIDSVWQRGAGGITPKHCCGVVPGRA